LERKFILGLLPLTSDREPDPSPPAVSPSHSFSFFFFLMAALKLING
jgi:hypothetical protein